MFFKEKDIVFVLNKKYEIISFLGRGKGGYSFLVRNEDTFYVLKKIHHEPCSFYTFSNKIQSEERDYYRLKELNLKMSKLIAIDRENEIIIKEYIKGKTILDLILLDIDVSKYKKQLLEILPNLYNANINIDYHPSNFVVNEENDLIYYIDYECNIYDERWNYQTWGKSTWNKEYILKERQNKS
ncbi:MAG: hypothetical protein ACI31G_04725 [Bacilli bacterium]